jgi:hypothetical protein
MQNQQELANMIATAMGEDKDKFKEKMEWLQNKWKNRNYGLLANLICPIIFNKVKPIYIAIIADNINYFKLYYESECKLKEALSMACLCGSQQIADFLLKTLNQSYLSKENEYTLGYVTTSPNIEWAKNIATQMAKAGKSMPKSVYGKESDDDVIDIIENIFETTTPDLQHNQTLPPAPVTFTSLGQQSFPAKENENYQADKQTAQALTLTLTMVASIDSHHITIPSNATQKQILAFAKQFRASYVEFYKQLVEPIVKSEKEKNNYIPPPSP